MATRKGTITVWKLGYAAHLRQRGRGVVTVSLIAPASEAHASEEKRCCQIKAKYEPNKWLKNSPLHKAQFESMLLSTENREKKRG